MKHQNGSFPRHVGTFGLLLLAVVIAVAAFTRQAHPAAAQATLASFEIESGVSNQDAGFVIEGIRIAQDFFIEQVGATIDQEVRVEVLAERAMDEASIAVASEDRITVFTGSIGWKQTSPAERYAVIVHEYTHFYQYLELGDDSFDSPAWFDEGIAEYLSVLAISDLGIIDRADFEAFWGMLLAREPIEQSLEELESWSVFQSAEGALYPLSYFGIAELIDGIELSAISDYYSLIDAGESFDDAFSLAFGLTPDQYYAEFDRWQYTIDAPDELPADIAVYVPIERESGIHVIAVPRTLEPDDQVIVHAQAAPATSCSLALIQPGSAGALLERTTFADGTGDIFWFVTVPASQPGGLVTIDMSCGSTHVTRVAILEP